MISSYYNNSYKSSKLLNIMPKRGKSNKKKEIKRNHLILLGVLILLLIIINLSIFFISYNPEPDEAFTTKVINVTDGDTFQIQGGKYVRLIGIDTPEKGFIGYQEAKVFLELLVLDKEVTLVKDISNTDDYGRLLRYAYVAQGDQFVFVNSELVKRGFAKTMFIEPDISKKSEIQAR